ncbi:MAG TPA: AI-2E family transporter [Usitatibacter sp.]|nr:AI-2E family transporter [Usitatibacter sp.]
MTAPREAPNRHEIAAWLIAAVLLVLALELGLLPALLAGLLVFELVHVIAPRLRLGHGGAGRAAAVALLAVAVVVLLTGLMFAVVAVMHSEGLPRLLQKMADILDQSRATLPAWVLSTLPSDTDAWREAVIDWLHEHAAELRHWGGEAGRVTVHILIGFVIGAMVALREARAAPAGGPLARALGERAARFGDAFRRVVFAQVRIAALNALFTAAYLLAALPLFGIRLPFAKTLVILTFVGGLIPIVGNLLSNTVIVVMSLSVSPALAIASLAFLVVVHKLEYFLNARIVGRGIHASAWELLVAMLLMEAAFGVAGLVAAPIYYAYVKDELAARGLV